MDFVYAALTIRLVLAFYTKETVFSLAHSIIDRIQHVELEIDMCHYTCFEGAESLGKEKTKHIDNCLPDLLLKLHVRATPGVVCTLVFTDLFWDDWSWGTLPFSEVLQRGPNFRTVSMKLEC